MRQVTRYLAMVSWCREMVTLYLSTCAHDDEIERLQEQLAACQKDAHDLWMMLDEIDTADDIAKHDDRLYRAMVRREHAKRFDDRFKWVMNYIDEAMKGDV